jgi:perosamine synthetase
MSGQDDFRRGIADVVGVPADHVTLFWKGRVALYAILRALGIGRGDEVVVPAFTCVAVPNAVMYAGAAPVYVDIDETTYSADPAAVAAALTPNTRAILAQSTFGLSSDLDALSDLAARHGAVVIDDCSHGLGGTYRGRPNGTAAHAAFYSTQWSKPISTGLGGIAVTRDPQLAHELQRLEGTAREPSRHDQALLRTMVMAREHVVTPRALSAGRAVYQAVSLAGLVPGSSSSHELEAPSMPGSFLTRMSPFQAALGAQRLKRLRETVLRRRATAHRYSEWLTTHGRMAAHEPSWATHAFLRYPLRVREREVFVKAARRRGLELGDWFHTPLYPVTGDLTPWGIHAGSHPVAERVMAEIVNLPTEPGGRELRAVEELLEASIDHVI